MGVLCAKPLFAKVCTEVGKGNTSVLRPRALPTVS